MAETPAIDYTSRDYAALRTDLIESIPRYLPEWTNRSESDFGIVMIEMFSYIGDILNYYIDRVANESYLATAVQRASVLSLAQMIDYRPAGRAAASTTLSFTVASDAAGSVTIPKGTQVSTKTEAGADPIIFETSADLGPIAVGDTGQVTANEGETKNEDSTSPVGVSDGTPDQTFPLYFANVIDGSLEVSVDEDGDGAGTAAVWRYVTHLIDGTSEDRVYTTFTDENNVVYVIFGDNVNGKIPTQGAVITAKYRVGQGAKGNVGQGTVTELVAPIIGISQVTNTTAATGGADEESVESIRVKGPRSLTTLERAITTSDYKTLSLKVPGVAKASAVADVYTHVVVYIAPAGGGTASQTLKNSVSNYLADKKMINTTVTVADPTYLPINVTVNPLNVLPQYNRGAVEQSVKNALAALFSVENTDFGQRVTLSEVYRTIAAVEGVDYSVVTALNHTGTGLGDVELLTNEIPSTGTISVTSTGGLIGS